MCMSRAKKFLEEANAIMASAEEQDRPLRPAERDYVDGLLKSAKEHGETERAFKEIGDKIGPVTQITRAGGGESTGGGPGDIFIRSQGYQTIKAGRGQTWSTGPVEVGSFSLIKGTLQESGVGGPGGGLVP